MKKGITYIFINMKIEFFFSDKFLKDLKNTKIKILLKIRRHQKKKKFYKVRQIIYLVLKKASHLQMTGYVFSLLSEYKKIKIHFLKF